MTNETTPIYEAIIAEMGNPIPATPVDRSYEAIVAESEALRAAAPGRHSATASLPAPAAALEGAPSMAGSAPHAG